MKLSESMSSTLFCLSIALLGAQEACPQAPATSERFFAQHGVSYTVPSLRAALRHPDPEVRSTAAGALANDRDVASIPLIRAALEREPVEHVKVTLAAALATLKDWQGSASLTRTCKDETAEPTTRLQAANHILDIGSDDCLLSVISIFANKPDPPSRELGMQYLRRTTYLPIASSPQLQQVLRDELQDPLPLNRQYASECISVLGDRNSIEALKEAVSIEKEPATRNHLEENLRRAILIRTK